MQLRIAGRPVHEPTAAPTPTTSGGPNSWPTLEPWMRRPTAAPAEAVPADITVTPPNRADGMIPTTRENATAEPMRTPSGSPGSCTAHTVRMIQPPPATNSPHRLTPRWSRNAPNRFEGTRSEEHTSELQSRQYLVCRLLLEK